MTHDLSAASVWKLALTELKTRLARLITGGKGVPVDMGKLKVTDCCSLLDCKLCRQVVNAYFDACKLDAVQADYGDMIDRIEAMGFLIGDILGVELLPLEARSWADKALARMRELEKTKPKPGPIEKLRGAVGVKRSRARRAAEKSDVAAAELSGKLEAINADWTAALVVIWAEHIEFEMPPPRSKIVEEKPIEQEEPPEPEVDDFDRWDEDLDAQQAKLDDATAAQWTAKIALEAAESKEERALRAVDRITLPDAAVLDKIGWLAGYEKKYDFGRTFPERERKHRQQLLDRYDVALEKLLVARTERQEAFIANAVAAKHVEFFTRELQMCQKHYDEWHKAHAEIAMVREERKALWAKVGAAEIAAAKAAGKYHDFTLGVYYPPSTFATAPAPESPTSVMAGCGTEAEGGVVV